MFYYYWNKDDRIRFANDPLC